MQQLGQLQSAGVTSFNQTLPSQQLPGIGGQPSTSQSLIQQNASSVLQAPLSVQQQAMPAIAHQQFPLFWYWNIVQLFSFSNTDCILQSAWSGPPTSSIASSTQSAKPSSAVNASPSVPLTCNWTEHTSPEGFKYYYNSITRESRLVYCFVVDFLSNLIFFQFLRTLTMLNHKQLVLLIIPESNRYQLESLPLILFCTCYSPSLSFHAGHPSCAGVGFEKQICRY
ncbi:hypothetical protein GW17_00011540 [Ensete ventricosum]|nr:hypothetical protein GW17_00011540 [Ensete ventricosum]